MIVFTFEKAKNSILILFLAQLCFIIINPLIFEYSQNEMSSKFRASIGSLFSLGLGVAGIISHLFFPTFRQ